MIWKLIKDFVAPKKFDPFSDAVLLLHAKRELQLIHGHLKDTNQLLVDVELPDGVRERLSLCLRISEFQAIRQKLLDRGQS